MKEWIKVNQPANGPAVVTVTIQDGNLSSRYSEKAMGNIERAVNTARDGAIRNLSYIRGAI